MFFINFNSCCNDLDSNFFLKSKSHNFRKNKNLLKKRSLSKRFVKLEESVSNKKDSLLEKIYWEKVWNNILYFLKKNKNKKTITLCFLFSEINLKKNKWYFTRKIFDQMVLVFYYNEISIFLKYLKPTLSNEKTTFSTMNINYFSHRYLKLRKYQNSRRILFHPIFKYNFILGIPEGTLFYNTVKIYEKTEISHSLENILYKLPFLLNFTYNLKKKKKNIDTCFSNIYFSFSPENFYRLHLKKKHNGGKNIFSFPFVFNYKNMKFRVISRYFFYFFFWRSKIELEIRRFLKFLTFSKWILKKTKYMEKTPILYLKKKEKKYPKVNQAFFFYLVMKLGIILQEIPNSLIVKIRFLCKCLNFNFGNNYHSYGKIWTKDIQNAIHFNLLSFSLFYLDLICSGPKIKNIHKPFVILLKDKILLLDDLSKLPQTVEKFVCFEFHRKETFSKIFFSFISKNGLLDFSRKYISRYILYSKLGYQKTLVDQLMKTEIKNLSLCVFSKIISSGLLSEKNLSNEIEYLKKFHQNGRWILIYKIFCMEQRNIRSWLLIRNNFEKIFNLQMASDKNF